MSHRNARLTIFARLELVRRVLERHVSVACAAAQLGVSRQTGSKWVARYRTCGEAGLVDRSSRPHQRRPRLGAVALRRIVAARFRQRIGTHQIAWKLGLCRSTVCAVLARLGLSRLGDLESPVESTVRCEHEQPGDLIHLDTKKLGRIGFGGGKRFGGPGRARRARGVGWSVVFAAVDDASRLAYVEELADEHGSTAAGFTRRALGFYGAHGITVRRLLDNGPEFVAFELTEWLAD